VRALKARAEDQAGEIARLRGALAAFEQSDANGRLKDSKLALKARAGSAEAQAERQAATINRLRSELAAAHERLARQAAHFMDEMRRVGSGSPPVSGQRTRHGGRKLVERVAHVRPALTADKSRPAKSATPPEVSNGPETPAGNGHAAHARPTDIAPPKSEAPGTSGMGNGSAPESQPSIPKEAIATPAVSDSAAEMPQTASIPERRKGRLLDRITGLVKN
jgi:hypothetical protein